MQCKFWFVSRVDGIKKGGGGGLSAWRAGEGSERVG